MTEEPDQVLPQGSREFQLDHLERLKADAELHIRFARSYLPMLRDMSHPRGLERVLCPWKTLKEGSYYLGNAYRLVETYTHCFPGPIDDRNMQLVDDMLVQLEFDPQYNSTGYTDEAYGGKAKCFVSLGQGKKYYELLHSELKKDVRLFINMVELAIEIPVERFLDSINGRLSAPPERLLEAIKNVQPSVVEYCIIRGDDVNWKDSDGRTPLHHATNTGNADIVSILLRNGANAALTTNENKTPLDIASLNGHRQCVEVLLQRVNLDKSNDFNRHDLLHSESKEGIRSFLQMLGLNIDRPIEMSSVNAKLALSKQLFEAIEDDNPFEVENCISKGVDVNLTNDRGQTPVFQACYTGNIDVLCTLLRNGAKVTQAGKKGHTPLHQASWLGYITCMEKLFQSVSCDELDAFINARSADGDTALHLAVEIGFVEVVICLLKHGAKFYTEDKYEYNNKCLCKKMANLLKLIEELFVDVKNGNVEAINKLKAVNPDEFLALTNARNYQGLTLLQLAVRNKQKHIVGELLKLLKEPHPVEHSGKLDSDQLETLRWFAELHMSFSNIYLPILRNMLQTNESDTNYYSPLKALKEGSYYLRNVYSLVKFYRECFPGRETFDQNLWVVNEALVALEFDPKHIQSMLTHEDYERKVLIIEPKGKGTKYQKLLRSGLKKDLRSFIEMVEFNIDVPIKKFLETFKERQSVLSKMFHVRVGNANSLVVEDCIKGGADIYAEDPAINNGRIDTVGTMEEEAGSQIADNGKTADAENCGNVSSCVSSPKHSQEEGSQDVRRGTRVGILDANFPRVLLTSEEMLLVQDSLLQAILDMQGVGPQPCFYDATLQRGWLEITCVDESTVTWLKGLLTECRPLASLDLRLVEGEDIPNLRPIYIRGRFPRSSGDDNSRILALIRGQNSGLSTEHWVVVNRSDESHLADLTIAVDPASAAALMASSGNIYYRFGQVTLEVGSWEAVGGKDSEPTLTEEI